MRVLEIILLMTVVASAALKYNYYPTSLILITSTVLLGNLYFLFSFALLNKIRFRQILKKKSYAGIGAVHILAAVGTGMALSTALVGVMFQVQFYPGASLMLKVGGFSLLLISLVFLVLSVRRLTPLRVNILKRTIPIALITLFMLSFGYEQLIRWRYPHHPEYVKAVLKYRENPRNGELREKMQIEQEKMEADKR